MPPQWARAIASVASSPTAETTHGPLTDAREQDLVANLLAEFTEVEAIALQHIPELAQRQLIAVGDAGQRLGELHVVHPKTVVLRHLQLKPVKDQAL